MNTTKTILVADDDPVITETIQITLSHSFECSLMIAQDGEEAWQALQENTMELIISDWNMPIKTGAPLLEDVRKNERLSHIPCLMLTSRSDKDSVLEMIGAGVSQYMNKLFDHQTLVAKISQILGIDLPTLEDKLPGLPEDDNLLDGWTALGRQLIKHFSPLPGNHFL